MYVLTGNRLPKYPQHMCNTCAHPCIRFPDRLSEHKQLYSRNRQQITGIIREIIQLANYPSSDIRVLYKFSRRAMNGSPKYFARAVWLTISFLFLFNGNLNANITYYRVDLKCK